MRITLGEYILEVNIEATKEYYKRAKYILEDCQCDGCQNYVKAVEKSLNLRVREFFNNLGVDIKKSQEVYVNCSENNILYYGGFYHICGTIVKGKSPWQLKSESGKSLNEDMLVCIAKGFSVGFQNECNLLSEDFPEPCIQMEIFAYLPWVLEVENGYS